MGGLKLIFPQGVRISLFLYKDAVLYEELTFWKSSEKNDRKILLKNIIFKCILNKPCCAKILVL